MTVVDDWSHTGHTASLLDGGRVDTTQFADVQVLRAERTAKGRAEEASLDCR